ncbi:MAG: hypothetical protein O2898_05255 [Proteobacteria bacterium]|jgi:hypothetical protein|nr:hypothetical protein [Pseudomonadota bacterium]
MSGVCRAAIRVFGLLYLVALALLVIGLFGLFGTEPGPLAGVFVIPLGMPWIKLVDALPEPLWPWAAAASPLVNLLILTALCRFTSARRG